MNLSRRNFLHLMGVGVGGVVIASPLKKLYSRFDSGQSISINKFGSLIPDPKGILDLPPGFEYKIISPVGEMMNDGYPVPDNHDGMAAFSGDNDEIILIRNHELNPVYTKNKFPQDLPQYDSLCPGGTTTLVLDKELNLKKHYLSLAGTIRNCGGGKTPWNTWISSEENTATPYTPPGYTLEQALSQWGKVSVKHGYNFEVPITGGIQQPIPLKAMGRFHHEAIAVDPETGYIYQTEDRNDSCLYRFIPQESQNLQKGGILEAMVIKNMPKVNTALNFPQDKAYSVEWVRLEDVDPTHDTLRYEAQSQGAAIFKRGEGICYAEGEIYWTCTSGGNAEVGQIFRYNLDRESIELFAESPGVGVLDYPDNLIVAPFGDLIVCEDGKGEQFLVGITPEGKYYQFARNALNNSEFAGVCFSGDGNTMFVNIYRPGMTVAISGNW